VAVAPDSFKGTLDAPEAAEAIARGVRRVAPRASCRLLPMADGGEGTAALLARVTGGRLESTWTEDPLGRPLRGSLACLGDGRTWAVDVAAASGLTLLSEPERDPLGTSSTGTGRLIRAALEGGADKVILGLGGSATVDGGKGLCEALGFAFLDADGRPLAPGGESLRKLDRIEDPRPPSWYRHLYGRIDAACDVRNPLLGPGGTARVFAPQKGATPSQVTTLEAGLTHLAEVLRRRPAPLGSFAGDAHRLGAGGSRPAVAARPAVVARPAAPGGDGSAPEDIATRPGSGAAGGIGAAVAALLGARLQSGGERVFTAAGYADQLDGCDLVIVGEGRLDSQSASGKAPAVVAEHARQRGLPVVAVVGTWEPGVEGVPVQDWEAGRSPGTGIPSPVEARKELTAAAERLLSRWVTSA
jgi:glycerate kinase